MPPGGEAGVQLGLGPGAGGGGGCDVGDADHGLVLGVPVDDGI